MTSLTCEEEKVAGGMTSQCSIVCLNQIRQAVHSFETKSVLLGYHNTLEQFHKCWCIIANISIATAFSVLLIFVSAFNNRGKLFVIQIACLSNCLLIIYMIAQIHTWKQPLASTSGC